MSIPATPYIQVALSPIVLGTGLWMLRAVAVQRSRLSKWDIALGLAMGLFSIALGLFSLAAIREIV